VLLTPNRFLQDIPQRITAGGFYTWAESQVNAVLREDLNYDLGKVFRSARTAPVGPTHGVAAATGTLHLRDRGGWA